MKSSSHRKKVARGLPSLETPNMKTILLSAAAVCALVGPLSVCAADDVVLVEAEQFRDFGGWAHDPQFMDQMGSPYLLAHGLGVPVADATTEVALPAAGDYRVWVRTKDWVAQWEAPGTPGRFEVVLNGTPLKTVFGTVGAQWHWQDGGTVRIPAGKTRIALHDLTGFEGRCDALLFARDPQFVPPHNGEELAALRRRLLGLPEQPEEAGSFDLVVCGGGMAGTCAAISAARLGMRTALIQDRPVLGGNNSSEVRVWLQGARNKEPWPRVGDVVGELESAKRAHYGPTNTKELYEDEKKLGVARGETNLTMFLQHRANGAETAGGKIRAVVAQDEISGRRFRFAARWFADCTGDGALGALAGAEFEMTRVGHMGICNLWNVAPAGAASPFPRCPWALDLSDRPFPGRNKTKPDILQLGGWYWESGFERDPIAEMEYVRDWNFRAMYGAWDAMKNVDGVLPDWKLNWCAHIMGKRESRRLMGEVVVTLDDLEEQKQFPDGCVPTGWKVDLHGPDPRYESGFEGDAFISKAEFGTYKMPFWIPYRALYSRNIPNLFMAGRCISVTHEALGAVRVMRTAGCMGEVVGMAASVCKKRDASPRDVWKEYLPELQSLMRTGVGKNPGANPVYDNQGEARPQPKKAAAALAPPAWIQTAGPNLAPSAQVTVSGSKTSPALLTDAKADLARNDGRWISDTKMPNAVEFSWDQPQEIGAVRIVSGYRHEGGAVDSPIRDFVLQFLDRDIWVDLAKVEDNERVDWSATCHPVRASKVRLEVMQTPTDTSRIWEIEIYGAVKPAPAP